MAETHELRLKINAAAARAGSREFVGAIANIKRAVTELDRLSDGTFKRLSKNAQDAGKSAKVKINPIDRTAIRNLDEFAKIQAQVIRQTANSRQGLAGLMDGLRNVSGAYVTARGNSDAYTTSLIRTNTALTRQAQLLSQVSSASRRAGSQASVQTTSPVAASDRAAQNQVAMQNRVQRAVDDTRLSVERLVTQLMKLSGFQQINQVTRALRDFQREVSKSSLTTAELDVAKTRLNTSLRKAQTAVVTLTAKEQENARAAREAAAAARQHTEAARRNQAAMREAATAAKQHTTETDRQQALSLSSAAAMRRAAEETARLSERLRRIGDTKGLAAINAALNQFRSSVGAGVTSAAQLRTAISQFGEAASRTKIGLTQMEGAQRRAAESARLLAKQEREAASQARRVEREMRSIAGASSAASRAFRDATGSMRGLENAFSTTFQIGSAFRTMLGSITFGTFIQGVFSAGRALEQFRTTMEVATGSVSGALGQTDFINSMAQELGTSLRTAREDFSKFAVAANLAGVETATAQNIFRSVSQAMTVMGRGAEDQRLAFLALEQMLSKNVVSSEELRRQLGERLPGAVNLMARAVGVTTAELQDMLKAGELVSSEVLPKFAKEVDRAFGPGLERALSRAPAALGRFQNELEFFLSSIADSGFMDTLAAGFNRLTEAMRSPDAAQAAAKLGAGLSDLTAIATTFADSVIRNIDLIGTAAKAILGGLILRQIGLLGGAFLAGAGRIGIATQQLFAHFARLTSGTSVATSGLTKLQAQQLRTATSSVTLQKSVTASSIALGRSGVAAGTFAAGMATVSRAAGAAAVGVTGLSRIFLTLSGPIGIGIAALSLLPLAFSDTEDAAQDMASSVEAAVRRSGTALETLQSVDVLSASRQSFNQIISDLDVLDKKLSLASDSIADYQAALNTTAKVMQNGLSRTAVFAREQRNTLLGVGISPDDLKGLDATAKNVIKNALAMATSASEGQKSWVSLYEEIRKISNIDPKAEQVLSGLLDIARANAEAELAASAHEEQLIRLFGTKDDKAVVQFSQMALAALRAGEGFESLQDEINKVKGEAPDLAKRYKDVLDKIALDFSKGVSIPEIRVSLSDSFGESKNKLKELQKEYENTARSAAKMQETFSENTSAFLSRFSADGVDASGISKIREILQDFAKFEDAKISVDNINVALSALEFPNQEAQTFTNAVVTQFASIEASKQTYDAFRLVVENVAKQFDSAGKSTGGFDQALADTVRQASNASATSEDLRAKLSALLLEYGYTAESAEEAAGWLFQSADAATSAGRAAADAESGLIAAANGLDHIADGAGGATAQLRGVLSALNALRGVSAAIPTAAAGIVEEIQFKVDQKKRAVYEREAADFVRKQQKAINDKFDAALSQATSLGTDRGLLVAAARADKDAAMQAVKDGAAEITKISRELYETEAWKDPKKGSRRKRGGGRKKTGKSDLNSAQKLKKAVENLSKSLEESLNSIQSNSNAMALLYSGYTSSEAAAKMLGEAQAAGVNIFDESTKAMIRQIEAAEKLNEALSRLANDPVNDWMNSVPVWREAGQQIEVGVLNHLSDAISNFIKTGEFSFSDLGDAILGTVADIVADKAVKELTALLGGNTTGSGEGGFGLGGFLSGIFGNGGSLGDDPDPFAGGSGGEMAMQSAIVSGAQQGSEIIRTAMVSAGQQVGQLVQSGGQTAGTFMGGQIQTAGATAGAQMSTQTVSGGAIAGAQMMTQTQTGGTIAAQQMQQGIMQGGAVAAQQMSAASSGGGLFGGGFTSTLLGAGIGLIGSVFSRNRSTSNSNDNKTVTPVGIRQYSEGTPNTSGIPALLHDNEAVIPLSKGRKVPVELTENEQKNKPVTVTQNIYITTPDAESFRKSQKQVAAEMARAGRQALASNG